MIHLRFLSSNAGNLYLFNDVRLIIPHNSSSNIHDPSFESNDIQIEYSIPNPKYFKHLEYNFIV